MNKIPFKEILKAFVVFVLGVLIVVGVGRLTNHFDQPKPVIIPPEAIRPVVECPKDFESFEKTKTGHSVVLLANAGSFGLDGSFGDQMHRVSLKRTGLNSQIACGYLFYRLSINGKPIQQKYENLFMLPADGQFGGHIVPDERLVIRNQDADGKTEILLPLDGISHDGTTRTNIRLSDWSALLNVSDRMAFDIALNTLDKAGRIDLVEIAYKCWNPRTGAETDDCKLEVINTP